MIRYSFRERKAAQAAAFLVSKHGGEMYYLALIKLLYLADRRALIERGSPITGDRLVSMDYGPVLSRIKDLVSMEPEPEAPGTIWRSYVSEPTGYKVKARKSPDLDELSEYELEVLSDIYALHGKTDRFVLSKQTHDLPEWRDPNGSSWPIDPEDILRAAGKSREEIGQIGNDAEEVLFVRSLLAVR